MWVHWATNRPRDRLAMSLMVSSDSGMVTNAITASRGEMISIRMTTPITRQDGGQHLAEGLLEALGDVVDVVGDPAEEIAAGLTVDPAQGKAVELLFDVGPHAVHGSLHDARQDVGLEVGQAGGDDVGPRGQVAARRAVGGS